MLFFSLTNFLEIPQYNISQNIFYKVMVPLVRLWFFISFRQSNNYLFKITNRKPRNRCEICLKLTIKAPEWRQLHRLDVFIVRFVHITDLFLVFFFPGLSIICLLGTRMWQPFRVKSVHISCEVTRFRIKY